MPAATLKLASPDTDPDALEALLDALERAFPQPAYPPSLPIGHQVIDHLETYAKGQVHTNGLENFWSLFKRALKGTYVSVEPFHLFRYCDEQAFRFNERKDDDQGRFIKALQGVAGKGLRYAKLIGQEDGGSLPPQTAGAW